MLENIKQYLNKVPSHLQLNALKEYMQWLILKSIDTLHYRKSLAFVGGTALRIVYKTNRFSEDLDFSLIDNNKKFDFKEAVNKISTDLRLYGLKVGCFQVKEEKTVLSCFFRFEELLYELDLTMNKRQKLSIKFEIDSNPPKGSSVKEYLFNDPFLFSINHFDLPSLFSGKLHALLFRKYVKGRDYFDLLFFLIKKSSFNFSLFKNSATQTHPHINFLKPLDVMNNLEDVIKKMDIQKIQDDLKPFLLEQDDIKNIDTNILLKLLEQNIESGIYLT